jgi:hypothetical protein
MKKRLPQIQIVQAIEAFSLAGNNSPWQHENICRLSESRKKDLGKTSPFKSAGRPCSLKNEFMCLIYSYILATFFSQAYIKLKEKEIKVGKGKKGRSWQIRQYYDV